MVSEAREATAATVHEQPASLFQLAYAFILVGAGVLAVFTFLYGVTHSPGPHGLLWALTGLVGYLAVWAWGIMLAQS